ncbi:hypothetical protein ABFX02_04G172800 [Erythranthe guttata]
MGFEATANSLQQFFLQLAQKPNFRSLKAHEISSAKTNSAKSQPPHRYTPLKKAYLEIYTLIYDEDEIKVDMRMNLKARLVDFKTRPDTSDTSNLKKYADFDDITLLITKIRREFHWIYT